MPYFLMIMILDNGKTNAMGRLEYNSVMRHRNPMVYTMTHAAFIFFSGGISHGSPCLSSAGGHSSITCIYLRGGTERGIRKSNPPRWILE
jgi:hypothetical protein